MRGPKFRNGFTLIETIFSTLFIGIAVLAIVNLFPAAYLSIRKSESQLQADMVAKSVLDDLRLATFAYIAEHTKSDGSYEDVGPPYDPWTIENITYTPKIEIYEVPGARFDFLKGVRITVSYRVQLVESKLVAETYLQKLIR